MKSTHRAAIGQALADLALPAGTYADTYRIGTDEIDVRIVVRHRVATDAADETRAAIVAAATAEPWRIRRCGVSKERRGFLLRSFCNVRPQWCALTPPHASLVCVCNQHRSAYPDAAWSPLPRELEQLQKQQRREHGW